MYIYVIQLVKHVCHRKLWKFYSSPISFVVVIIVFVVVFVIVLVA